MGGFSLWHWLITIAIIIVIAKLVIGLMRRLSDPAERDEHAKRWWWWNNQNKRH